MATTKGVLFGLLILGFLSDSLAQQKGIFQDSVYIFSSDLPPAIQNVNLNGVHYSSYLGQKINFGLITQHNRWCYILIKIVSNTERDKYVLSVDNTSIDTVQLYRLTDDGNKKELYAGGNLIPYNKSRNHVWHTAILDVGKGESYYLAAFCEQGKNLNVGYKIMSESQLEKLYEKFDRLIWFYLGAVFLILVAVICSWLIFKNKALGYYAFYIVSITGWLLSHYGYLYPLLYPGLPILNGVVKPMTITCALLFFCCFIYALFRSILLQDKVSALVLKYLIRSGIIIMATFLIYPFVFQKDKTLPVVFSLLWHSYFSISFALLLLIVWRLFRRSMIARLFAMAMGIMLIMAIFQVFSNSGVFQYIFLNDHGMLLASLVEMIILSFATFLSIWQERKQIAKQVVQLEEANSKALEQLVFVQENERKRIAGELHDSIGPMLAALKINFQFIIRAKDKTDMPDSLVARTEDIIDGSMMEIRNISHQLMPKALQSEGLIATLTAYFENLQTIYNIPFQFSHNVSTIIHKDIQLNIYRIISELVLNAAKYSKASFISASIETLSETVVILVKDNGIGFDVLQQKDDSFGLTNIKSRVNYLKGSTVIKSAEGIGTNVRIEIPL